MFALWPSAIFSHVRIEMAEYRILKREYRIQNSNIIYTIQNAENVYTCVEIHITEMHKKVGYRKQNKKSGIILSQENTASAKKM